MKNAADEVRSKCKSTQIHIKLSKANIYGSVHIVQRVSKLMENVIM